MFRAAGGYMFRAVYALDWAVGALDWVVGALLQGAHADRVRDAHSTRLGRQSNDERQTNPKGCI